MAIVAIEVVEVDLELVEAHVRHTQRVLVAEVRVKADAFLPAECGQAGFLELVRIVNVHGHHALSIVYALAAQVPRQVAGEVQEAAVLILVRCERVAFGALHVADEQPIDGGQVAHIVDLVGAVEHKAVLVVLVGRVVHGHDVRHLAGVEALRLEIGVQSVEYELDGEVAQVVAHAEVEVLRAAHFVLGLDDVLEPLDVLLDRWLLIISR